MTNATGGSSNRKRDEDVLALLRVIFHDEFCKTEQVSEAQKVMILPAYFYGWLDSNANSLEIDCYAESLCEKAGVEYETWHNLMEIVSGGLAVEKLANLWYAIVLSTRPDTGLKITSINIVMNVTFEDKSISTTQALVTQEMIGATKMDDAATFTTLKQLLDNIMTSTVVTGVAGLHAEAQRNVFVSPAQEDPYDVIMGFILKHLIQGHPCDGKLKPELVAPVVNYFNLIRQMIRPKLAANVMSEYRRREAAKNSEIKSPTGGWNG